VKFGSLQVRTPDGVAREFPIDLPSLVVGRADGNGIVIDDLSISRRHARIVIESGRLLVEDLGSAAGTFVGGHRIDPHVSNLVETDQDIRFGDVQAQFVPPRPDRFGSRSRDCGAGGGAGYEAVEAPSRAINIPSPRRRRR
jgi:pSer/pThr/pTyr-binding forkhead associated (FHA) protein